MVISIKNIREDKGMSIRQVEYKTGLSRSHISDIETGKTIPRIDDVCKFAHGLQIEPVSLFSIMIEGEPWNAKS